MNGSDAAYKSILPRIDRARFRGDRLAVFIMLHCGAAAALLPTFFELRWMFLAIILHFLFAGVGISMGVHRYFSHKSFATYPWVSRFLAICAALNWQGGPMWWVATHHRHHGAADEPEDPHSPNEGFMWAHFRWVLYDNMWSDFHDYKTHAQHMLKDPVIVAIEKGKYLWQIPLALVLWFAGGASAVLWCICMRLVLSYHSTWFVNSACHTWGYKEYANRDRARNLWWVALIAYGEGWHNNHHSFAGSARIGLRWWQIDPIWWLIYLCGLTRLVWNVRVAGPDGKYKTLFNRDEPGSISTRS